MPRGVWQKWRPDSEAHSPVGFVLASRYMKAVAVVPKEKQVVLKEDHVTPSVGGDTGVLIKCLEVGICGTDREICTFVYGTPPANSDYLVLGHESLGQVLEVGSAVTGLKPGDLVVPSVRRPCVNPACSPCAEGLQDFCATDDFVERGIRERHGYMTEMYAEDQKYLFQVDPKLRDVAVLVEPLTIAEKAMAQVWKTQQRLPWSKVTDPSQPKGQGLKAVVLGCGPIGILGAMKLVAEGFETYVYSRSRKPNPKAALVESIGAKYFSALDHDFAEVAAEIGQIDLVYEGLGVSTVAYDVLRYLGMNGVFVFTGIPAPSQPIPVLGDEIMRNVVLKNQIVIGTVNAGAQAFEDALTDLGIFVERWPDAIRSVITGRFSIDTYEKLLVDKAVGIKNVIAFD